MTLLGKTKQIPHVFMKVRGILVPFFQSNNQFESDFVITTDDGKEFTLLKSGQQKHLDNLTWSMVEVFGYIITEHDGRKVLKVEHFQCCDEDTLHPTPFTEPMQPTLKTSSF